MSRWVSLLGLLACGCVDYQFASAKDNGGAFGDAESLLAGMGDSAGDTGAAGDGETSSYTGETGAGGEGGEGVCVVTENLTQWLDTFQVTGDARVLYCHGTGGGQFVLVESDISACFPHLDHRWDVFPSTGCDS